MRIAFIVVAAVLALSCSNKGSVCEPGDTRPCTCGDLEGHQDCNHAGTGWEVCDCSPVDAGTDSGADVASEPVEDPTVEPVEDPIVETVEDADDDSPPCDETPCGLLPNCGCPPGRKCAINSETDERHCIVAGAGTEADPCEDNGDCDEETVCIRLYSYAGETEALCHRYCESSDDCPGDAAVCRGVLPSEPEIGICSIGCDLLTSDPCPDGTKCKWLETSLGVWYTDCIADVGTGMMGNSCTTEEHCARGYFCSEGTCVGYCRISPAPDTCTFGCRQFSIGGSPADLIFDGVSYGFCWP
ncbi:MAG: hypothetical protein JRG91_16600 [Deltaproteobacteria bacterium]|nr:hypothetical protein [Deltaproteobacteria bacterium]